MRVEADDDDDSDLDLSNDSSNVTGGSASIFQTGAVALYLGMNNGARPDDVRAAIMDATQPTVLILFPPPFLSWAV